MIFHGIVCWKEILMKYNKYLIFLKTQKDVIKFVVCCIVFLKELIEKKVIFERKSANLKKGMKTPTKRSNAQHLVEY